MPDDRHDTPWDTLRRLVDTGSTGELIIASDAVEIHVYLLDGRLAWATSSTARNEFLRRLVEDHGIASDVLRDVIEECRQTRGRLGETLISWGVATAEQIRDALRGQIEEALVTAVAHPGARCLFLPRRLQYAAELTFALDDVQLDAVTAGRSSDTAHRVVTTVLDGVPDALWVEVVERGAISAPGSPRWPASCCARPPSAPVRRRPSSAPMRCASWSSTAGRATSASSGS